MSQRMVHAARPGIRLKPSKRTPPEREGEALWMVFDSMTAKVLYLDIEGRILRVNKSVRNRFGSPDRFAAGKTLDECLSHDDAASLMAENKKVILSGKAVMGVIERNPFPKGKGRWAQVDKIPYFDDKGKVAGVIVVVNDVTEQRETEESLHDSRLRLKEATDLARVVFWEVDLETKTILLNDPFYAFMGTTAEAEGGYRMTMEKYIRRFVYAEDRPVVRKRRKTIDFDNKAPVPDEEHRYVRNDGEVRHGLVRTRFIRDTHGRIVKHFGALQDITDHKRAEKRYRDLFENANEAIFVAQDGRVMFLNRTTAMMLGYPVGELSGKSFVPFIHPEDRKTIVDGHLRLLLGGEAPPTRMFRLIHRDGTVRWVELNTVLIDWEGKAASLNFMADITDRKNGEEKLEATLRNLRMAIGGTIQAIVQVVDRRDPYTAGHQRRVSDLARSIATKMRLPGDTIEAIRMAAVIHDIGKISVPAEILSKPGSLTRIEFELIKEHANTGYEILKDVEFPWPIAEIIHQHHERLNGSGYPRGLAGADILLEARIISVADVIEAIASHRPYRPALGIGAALDEIRKYRGTLYDPKAAEVCLRLFEVEGYELTE